MAPDSSKVYGRIRMKWKFLLKEVSPEVMVLGVYVCLTTAKLILILFLLIQQVYMTTILVFQAVVVSVCISGRSDIWYSCIVYVCMY